jgi:hypothetical protein
MGIVGATELVAKATAAAHVKNVETWKIHWSALPVQAAKDYIALNEAWWCRILASLGLNDKLLAAHARVDEGGD